MIKNESEFKGRHIEDMRNAFEHRALWLYVLYKEAVSAGLSEDFARKAIKKCGNFHGAHKFTHTDDFEIFHKEFVNDNVKDIFQMEDICNEGNLNVDFHYCPLVSAWKKIGASDDEIALLCDIAMDGDRGICEVLGLDFKLGKTIAKGDPICEIRIKQTNKNTTAS